MRRGDAGQRGDTEEREDNGEIQGRKSEERIRGIDDGKEQRRERTEEGA
jgi:hypothetical protein